MRKGRSSIIIMGIISCICLYYSMSINFLKSTNKDNGLTAQGNEEKYFKDSEVPKCSSKVTKIGYLKTHKCGSSTISNMLVRFAVNNNLNVVPQPQSNIKYSRSHMKNTLWGQAELEYDIFCFHTIWDQTEVSATLGKNAFYFTMLRHPVDLFVSLWDYSHLQKYYNITLEDFAKSEKKGKLAQRQHGLYGRNMMLFDFGLEEKDMDNSTAIDQKILEVDTNFDLILLHERFDESMVLLKDRLCWNISDVLSLKLNKRANSVKSKLSYEARNALEDYLEADMRLYNHFKLKYDKFKQTFDDSWIQEEKAKIEKESFEIKKICNITESITEYKTSEQGEIDTSLTKAGWVSESKDPKCRLMISSTWQELGKLVYENIFAKISSHKPIKVIYLE